MLAEAFAVNIKQAAAVVGLLLLHAVEDLRRSGVVLPQTVGEVGENAGVLLLQADCQSQDFAFTQTIEATHAAVILLLPADTSVPSHRVNPPPKFVFLYYSSPVSSRV